MQTEKNRVFSGKYAEKTRKKGTKKWIKCILHCVGTVNEKADFRVNKGKIGFCLFYVVLKRN